MSKLDRLKHFLRFNLWIVLLDMVAFCLSYLAALYIRMYVNGVWRFGAYYQDYFWSYIPYYVIVSVIVFGAFRLYGGMWQYAGLHDLNRIISANLVTVALHYGISALAFAIIPDSADVKETAMIRKMIYRYQRPDGGFTVSPVKPDGPYNIRWRLIAEEGMAITNGETAVTVIDVIHRNDCDVWADCELPDELRTIEIDEGVQ